jgi:type I restriction enzyme S subunit
MPRFVWYFMNCPAGREQLIFRSSTTTGLRNLNGAILGSLVISTPLSEEQRDIVAFLDRETAKIDALLAKKERLIELLQEKRTALITQAVTKGLDPSVPMKDSGIEWLGKIPAHWEVSSLKRRAKRIQTGTTPPTEETRYYENGVIPWYGPGSFAEDLPIQKPVKFISESALHDGVARMFEAHSALIVTIGATIGKVAFMEHPGSCNQQITCVTFDIRQVFPKYGAYQLKRLEPVLRGRAPNTTLPIIDQEEVGSLSFVAPLFSEQEAIVVFLERETAMIDALVAKILEAIDRLKEYRTALISAAVTGKIDVRISN